MCAAWPFVVQLLVSGGRGRVSLTQALGQQVLDELGVVAHVQHAVHAGVHQLLLVVAQVLRHVLRHKHHVAVRVHHEEEAVQGLGEGRGKGWDHTPAFALMFLSSGHCSGT